MITSASTAPGTSRKNRLPADPIRLQAALWPTRRFYREQVDIVYSVWEDDETWVSAGNKLGKDYVAGFVVPAAFVTRRPCRIVTTSAKDEHLRVLWGEINGWVQSCAMPLDRRRGGPLILRQREIRWWSTRTGRECDTSYVTGMVASPDSIAAMQGHHVAKTGDGVWRTLFVSDESSSVPSDYFRMARTWCNRLLGFGNPWPCDNDFKWAVKGNPATGDPGGDVPRPNGRPGYERRVFNLGAEDSPNVRFARWQLEQGMEPTNAIVVPGVKDWEEYQRDRRRMDRVQQCVSLDGRFYEGGENLLFPPEWLNWAESLDLQVAERVARGLRRKAKGMGVDPAEGGDDAVWTVVDELGVIEQVSYQTPDTNVIPAQTKALLKKHGLDPGQCVFDRGGGGKQHADRLKAEGWFVRSVGFGEAVTPDPEYGKKFPEDRTEERQARYAYVNRRAEMFGRLSDRLNPKGQWGGFALGRELAECRRQLAPLPRLYDGEGRLYLPPKGRKPGKLANDQKTLTELLGCSPDEADSLALAVWAMENPAHVVIVG